jgi:hypothetical protein
VCTEDVSVSLARNGAVCEVALFIDLKHIYSTVGGSGERDVEVAERVAEHNLVM